VKKRAHGLTLGDVVTLRRGRRRMIVDGLGERGYALRSFEERRRSGLTGWITLAWFSTRSLARATDGAPRTATPEGGAVGSTP
jgi:uncharacterized protein YodC (DUF2158 family)